MKRVTRKVCYTSYRGRVSLTESTVLRQCALQTDLDILGAGDMTEVSTLR